MRLFLVRHGETESNRLGLALGRNDVPLNERGRWQAERLADALRGEPLAAVYSSPLRRTLETARPVAGAHGLEVTVEEQLIEMDIGELDGLTFAEVRTRYPGLLEEWVSGPGPSMPMPGGERLVDVQERAWSAVTDLAARHGEEAVAAVTHNFVILSLLTKVLGIELSHFRRLQHAVAAVSVVDLAPGRTLLVRMNDTCHLEGG
ncbi:MAG TPA: histidine phosphatase family protein [Dehalococcoidia bacterium]|nr:histidine phosphatase family protein [Dehalococcoidia bacterium]